jgi:hypothetical protein
MKASMAAIESNRKRVSANGVSAWLSKINGENISGNISQHGGKQRVKAGEIISAKLAKKAYSGIEMASKKYRQPYRK